MCIFSFFQNFKTWPHVWPTKSQLVPIYKPFKIILVEATYNNSKKNHMEISPLIIHT